MVSLVGPIDKKGASHLFEVRVRNQYSDQSSSQIRAPCVASIGVGTEGERGPNSQLASIKRTVDGRRQRNTKII